MVYFLQLFHKYMKNIYEIIAESLDRELDLPLNEMAQSKKAAILELNYLEDTYFEHICKIVLYDNSTRNLYHWVGEVAQCLSEINDIKIEPDNKKISEQLLRDEFFLANGDSASECGFHLVRVSKKLFERYPRVEITEEMRQHLFDVLSDISNYFVPVIASKNNYSKEWFRSKLIGYFEE